MCGYTDKKNRLLISRLGVQDRKIKMVFNTGGTWRWVTFENE